MSTSYLQLDQEDGTDEQNDTLVRPGQHVSALLLLTRKRFNRLLIAKFVLFFALVILAGTADFLAFYWAMILVGTILVTLALLYTSYVYCNEPKVRKPLRFCAIFSVIILVWPCIVYLDVYNDIDNYNQCFPCESDSDSCPPGYYGACIFELTQYTCHKRYDKTPDVNALNCTNTEYNGKPASDYSCYVCGSPMAKDDINLSVASIVIFVILWILFLFFGGTFTQNIKVFDQIYRI